MIMFTTQFPAAPPIHPWWCDTNPRGASTERPHHRGVEPSKRLPTRTGLIPLLRRRIGLRRRGRIVSLAGDRRLLRSTRRLLRQFFLVHDRPPCTGHDTHREWADHP